MREQTSIPNTIQIWPPFLAAASILIIVVLASTLWVSLQIPEGAEIPIHWNAKGEVDGWGGRGSLWLMPATIFGLVALFSFLPLVEPRRGGALLSSKAYLLTGLSTLFVLSCVHAGILSTALGRDFPMLPVVFTAIGLLFIVIGNYLGKVRSNFVMGIRTPWTLSSELSWNKTHRLGGRLFALLGLGWIAVAWVGVDESALLWLVAGGVIALVGVTTVYSYVVWKNDPAKTGMTR